MSEMVPSMNSFVLKYVRKKNDNFCILPFYNHFWSFFCQLHKYLLQNLDSDSHFEGLNMCKSQLDQNLCHKSHFFLISVSFNFEEKKHLSSVPRHSITDHWIQAFMKWVLNSGLFLAGRAAEKKYNLP